MKKLAIGLCALVLLVIIGLLVAPLFLSPNDFKQVIQTRFKEKTGLELMLTGNIELSLFPIPKASVDEISVSNNSRILTTVKNITAYPKLGDLISGDFVVDALEVTEPKLVIEKVGGQYNWQQTVYNADKDSEKFADAAQSAANFSINSININNGHFEYRDKDKDKSYIAKNLQIQSSLASLEGPLTFAADAVFMDEKVSFNGEVNNFTKPNIKLTANFMGSDVSWDGELDKAKLAIKTNDIAPITKKFELKDIAYMAGKPISFSAEVTQSQENIQLQDMLLEVAETKGGGKVIIIPSEESLDISADLKFQNFNLEDIIPPQKLETEEDVIKLKKEFRESINQKKFVANLAIKSDVVKYKNSVFGDVNLQATYDDGNIVISQLSTSMAGTGKMEIAGILNKDSKGRAFDGTVTATSTDFRKFLNSLGMDASSVKEGGLKNFILSSDVYGRIRDEAKFDFSKTEALLDETQFAGSVGVIIAKDVNVDINGAFGEIDLAKYIIEKIEPVNITLAQKQQKNLEPKLEFEWLKNLSFRGKTNIAVGKIIYKGTTYSSGKIQSEFKPRQIEFSNISAASPNIQFAARGGLNINNLRPKLFIEANLGPIKTLDFIKAPTQVASALKEPAQSEERWSKEPFDFTPLDEIDIDFVINTPLVDHKGLMLDNLSLKGYLESSKVSLDKFNTGFFGGEIAMKGRFGIGAVPSADINFAATDFDLASVAKSLADNDRIYQGKMTINGGFRASGVHQRAMAESLEGSITIAGRDVWVKGFDVDAFASQITNISGPEALIPVGKTLTGDSNYTRINTITGGVLVGQGILKPQDLKMRTAYATGIYEGYADLVKWYMDTRAFFRITLADSKERPGLGIRVFGSISEPKQEKDFDELISYYSKRFARGILKIPQKEEISDPKDQLKNDLIQKGAEGLLRGLTQ